MQRGTVGVAGWGRGAVPVPGGACVFAGQPAGGAIRGGGGGAVVGGAGTGGEGGVGAAIGGPCAQERLFAGGEGVQAAHPGGDAGGEDVTQVAGGDDGDQGRKELSGLSAPNVFGVNGPWSVVSCAEPRFDNSLACERNGV